MHAPQAAGRTLLAGLSALVLVACGGGGGGGSSGGDGSPQAVTLTGIAATGAAFSGGAIQVTDGGGTVVGSGSTGTDGSFSIELPAAARAPYVVSATRPGVGGSTESLTSIVSSDAQTVVNVTPVTTLIAALLSPSGDPTRLAAELQAGAVQITPDTAAASIEKVQTILEPLLAATGTAGTDPVTGVFAADGTGYDRVLDSLKISIVPASAGANVEIEVRQQGEDTAQPTSVSFATSDTAPVVLPPVDATRLVAEGTSVRIATLLDELTACYALPLTQRVSTAVDDSTLAVGTAADVAAPACRGVFDGNDPASFLSNGARVGRTAGNAGAFASLFRPGATGVVFSQGSYEFSRANGDVVIGYKSRDTAGNEAFDTFVVRRTEADGKLRLIGNHYRYPGSIQSYHQLRQFSTLDQSAYDYRSVGYTLNVDNRVDGSGNSIFDRVEVTTPRNTVLTLRPSAGFSYLPLVRGGVVLGTNFLRLRSAFVSPPAGDPQIPSIDPNLFFSSIPFTDAEITAIPAQGVWTYRYFLAGNTGTTPDAVQAYKTRSRALSIDEFQQVTLSELNPAIVSSFAADADPVTGTLPLDTEGPAQIGDATEPGWSVPTGALPVTSVTIFGRYNGAGFNDSTNVGSTARFATVPCTRASVGDTHCGTTVTNAFAEGAVANGLHLFARDVNGREFANFYAAYRLVLPTP